MFDVDNAPLVLVGIIVGVFLLPFLYSFFVDKYEKGKTQIKT